MSRREKRSPELLSPNDVALLVMKKKKKKKKHLSAGGWRQMPPSSSSKKKNHQGRKLSMDTSFPAISALQPSCASAVTVTICWSKFPRVRRNDGIPPMHRYLRSPPLIYASPCEQLVFTRDSVCPAAASTRNTTRCLPPVGTRWPAGEARRRRCVARLRADRRPSA